jgi:hypothetical protein
MRTKILLTILVVSLLAACSKDKYQTRPQLKFKNSNTKVLKQNEFLTFTLEVTDAEGDIQDSMWIEQIVRNCANRTFKTKVKMPDFTATKNIKAEIELNYVYGSLDPNNPKFVPITHSACRTNDSTIFRFYLKDKANNMSDTAVSHEVVLIL